MKNILSLLLISLSLNIALTQTTPSKSTSLNDKIQTYLLSKNEFNGNVLIGKGNQIVFERSYGFADVKKTAPLNSHSKFNIGSISKTFPTLAILHLIEKGEIRFDQKVADFIVDLPSWSQEVSIKHLLFYQSGLPTASFQKENTDDSLMRQIQDIKQLKYSPGTNTLYSNLNIFLQAEIVEKVTQKPFKEYIKNLFFKKAKLKNASYFNFPFFDSIDENLSFAYSDFYGDDIEHNPRVKKFEVNFTMLYLTSKDLFKWTRWVLKKYNPNSAIHKVFFQESDLKNIWGPIGLLKLNDGKIKIWEPGGSAYSFLTLTHIDVEQDFSIILMTNRSWSKQFEYLEKMKSDLIQLMGEN